MNRLIFLLIVTIWIPIFSGNSQEHLSVETAIKIISIVEGKPYTKNPNIILKANTVFAYNAYYRVEEYSNEVSITDFGVEYRM